MLQRVLAVTQLRLSRLWKQERGQDLIEYALLAGFIAVAVSLVFPMSIAPNISAILGKVSALLAAAPSAPAGF